MNEHDILNAAADALTDDDGERYLALRNQHPQIDWHGHDHRYALLQLRLEYPNAEPSELVSKLPPDPFLEQYLLYIPWTIELPAGAIQRCAGCGAEIYWSQFNWKPHPYNVKDGGGTTQSHFDTCPKANDFRSTPKKQTTLGHKNAA